MSRERWREDHRTPGPSHPEHEPLITPPHSPSRQSVTPSERLKACAERYLKWFVNSQIDVQARYDLMATPISDANKIDSELSLIKVTRMLCPDMRVELERSDIGWNEASNVVFLMLSLKGKHTGQVKGVAPTGGDVRVKATVFIKVDNSTGKFADVGFILEEDLLARQIKLRRGALREIIPGVAS